MKIRSILATLLSLLAGLQTANAQVMKIWQNGKFDSYDVTIVESVQYVESVYEYVDLGLPSGTLWATCNIGANSPEEYGYYFSWGETQTKDEYTPGTYAYGGGTDGLGPFSKYNNEDGKMELLPEDDAATANWGAEWQMPSREQCIELLNEVFTTATKTTKNDKIGYLVTSKINGNSIFLPLGGCYFNDIEYEGTLGYYLSRTRDAEDPSRVDIILCFNNKVALNQSLRNPGQSVRPVRVEKKTREHEYVDLGLPSGTLWATCNIGANSPEEYGYYFSWGETETKSLFDWSTYKLLNEGETSWTQINKYTFADGQTEGCWYNGTSFIGDNNTRLLPADDAATANWGSKWSMPSKEQFEELINSDYTTTEWTTQNGANGYKITSISNSKSIFMPVAGEYYGSYLDASLGAYWSCELSTDYCNRANYLSFNSSHIYLTNFSRALGHSIRPVQVKEAVHVQEITLNEEYVCLYSYKEPKTVTLVATVLPENADNKAVKWESSNTRMAVVSKDGVVSILPDNYLWEEGECVITCSALDGSGVKATCTVRVDHGGSAL